MGYGKGKIEGGSGGKRGHSNMNHWDETEWIKEQSRRWRRLHAKWLIQQVKKGKLQQE